MVQNFGENKMAHSHGHNHGHSESLTADFLTNIATFGNLVELGGNILYALDLASLCNDINEYLHGNEDSVGDPPLTIVLPLAIIFGLCAIGSVFAHRNTDILLQENLTHAAHSRAHSTLHIKQRISDCMAAARTVSQNAHAQSGSGPIVPVLSQEQITPVDYDTADQNDKVSQHAQSPLIIKAESVPDYKATDSNDDADEAKSKGCWARILNCFSKAKKEASATKDSLSDMKRNFSTLKTCQKFSICGEFISHGSGIAGVTFEVIEKIANTASVQMSLKTRIITQGTVSLLSNFAALAPIRSCINGMVEVNRREKLSCSRI